MNLRSGLLARELVEQGYLRTPRIKRAFEEIDRGVFVSKALRGEAYRNVPLQIGHDQTISQPSVVAAMLEALQPRKGHRVLEVGTGSGYSTALLSHLVGKKGSVVSLELVPELAEAAKKKLGDRENVTVVRTDATAFIHPEQFDLLIVNAQATHIPKNLLALVKKSGRVIAPIGRGDRQTLFLMDNEGNLIKAILGVLFVPLVGAEK